MDSELVGFIAFLAGAVAILSGVLWLAKAKTGSRTDKVMDGVGRFFSPGPAFGLNVLGIVFWIWIIWMLIFDNPY
ncbi:hypothetical protein [Hyphococcus lacteus]|uniref:Uncharacterized protein n=1 Tax=Hyphococcus lacteus TaxID=3143536 RepID=A0ABV3Z3Q2_9PROT